MKNLLLLLTFNFLLLTFSIAQTGVLRHPTDGTVKWSTNNVGPGTFTDNPQNATIGPDGTVYVNTEQSYLVGIDPSDGTELWDLSGHIFPPAIAANGTLYSGSETDLVAISPDGTEQWRLPLGIDIFSSPALAEDGTVYVGAGQYLIAVDQVSHTILWQLNIGDTIENTPSVGYDGSVYVAAGNDLVAINPASPSELWRFTADDPITTSAALGASGMIYVGANSQLYAINPDGTEKWHFKRSAFIKAAPAIGSDGTIYLPMSYIASGYSGYGLLIALHPEGYEKWNLRTNYYNISTPTLGADGNIYMTTAGIEGLMAIDPYGNQIWRIPAFGNAWWSPPMAPDGTLYFASTLGLFVAVETNSGGLANAPWPMDSHDAQHTGRNDVFEPACQVPIITAEPENLLIEPDSVGALTVAADGDPPLSYQWYEGFTGDKSNPVDTGSSFTTPPLSESKQYWVEITNACGFTFSRGVTVAVGMEGEKRWYFISNEEILTSPALADDGTVYFGTESGTLYALNPDGTEEWEFQADFTPSLPYYGSIDNWIIWSSPTVATDGTIFFGSGALYYSSERSDQVVGGMLWALNPDGSEKWHYIVDESRTCWPDIISSAALALDGTIYVVDRKGRLHAINGDGSLKWRFEPTIDEYAGSHSSPSVGSDGTIYFTAHWLSDLYYQRVYAVNPDGTEKWYYESSDAGGYFVSAAIGSDGTIYLPGLNEYFLALNPDGTEKWRFYTGTPCSNASIGPDGTLYIGAGVNTNFSNVYALNPETGEQIWKSDNLNGETAVLAAPTVGADSVIYVNTGVIVALDPLDGSTKWIADAGGGPYSSPVISPDGTLYVGEGKGVISGTYGVLWAVTTSSMGLADSQWPAFGQNNAHLQIDPNATLICEEPVITSQPQDQTIVQGEQATITVTATGTAPLYQWYEGNPGDMTTPADTGAVLTTPPTLTSNKSYWVHVSNACGTAESEKATVTVLPSAVSQTEDDAMAVHIFPNPAVSFVSLQLPPKAFGAAIIGIYDLNGRKLLEKQIPKGTEEFTVDVSSLQSGLYFCRIRTEKGSVTKKLIIQK